MTMNALARSSSFKRRDWSRISSLAVVAIAHVVMIYLLTLSPARGAISNAPVIMVTLIREQPRGAPRPTRLPAPLPFKLQQIAVGWALVPINFHLA